MISLTDEVIVPAYQTVARDVAQLDQDVKALCDAPGDTSLEDDRRSWRRARASWMRSEAVWFGPVMERRSISLLDWSPTDAEGIDRLLAEARPITANEVRDALAANQRGFGAIERLLFSGGALAGLSQSAYYCSYLGALTAATRQEADAILSEWVDGTDHRPPYQDYFTDRANSALVSSAAVAQVIRTQVFSSESWWTCGWRRFWGSEAMALTCPQSRETRRIVACRTSVRRSSGCRPSMRDPDKTLLASQHWSCRYRRRPTSVCANSSTPPLQPSMGWKAPCALP